MDYSQLKELAETAGKAVEKVSSYSSKLSDIPQPFDYSILQDAVKTQVEIDPPDYEDTIFKDLAEDIKASQEGIASQINALAEENRKSSARSAAVSIAAFIVASLTLIATIYFGLR